MKRGGLQRVVQGDRNRVGRKSRMPEPDLAALLTNHLVAETLQCADQTICGYASRQLHAASTEISSSFT